VSSFARWWKNTDTGEKVLTQPNPQGLKRYAFSGVSILNPGVFKYFPPEEKFSIIDFFLGMINVFKS